MSGECNVTKCINCNVELDKHLRKCPLCLRRINSTNQSDIYPNYTYDTPAKSKKLRVLLFLTIIICSVSTLVNLLTLAVIPKLWFIYVIGIAIYVWVLTWHTIFSRKNLGSKIHMQIFALSFLLLVIDLNSGFHRWSVNIAIPVIISLAILMISIKMASEKMHFNNYIGYVMSAVVMGFIPLILYFAGVATLFWPSSVTTLSSLLAITGVYLFADKMFHAEFKRRFHL